MRILVTGSRDWDNSETIEQALAEETNNWLTGTIVHGGAKGADSIAGDLAFHKGLGLEVHFAQWSKFGKAAGFKRNKEMVDKGADVCLAFIKNNSKGATMCADLAQKAGIRVRRFYSE